MPFRPDDCGQPISSTVLQTPTVAGLHHNDMSQATVTDADHADSLAMGRVNLSDVIGEPIDLQPACMSMVPTIRTQGRPGDEPN